MKILVPDFILIFECRQEKVEKEAKEAKVVKEEKVKAARGVREREKGIIPSGKRAGPLGQGHTRGPTHSLSSYRVG